MRFNSVQILRAVAANLVVFSHIYAIESKYHPSNTWLPAYVYGFGDLGVKIFFVISGFVIVQAARRESWAHFAFNRVTRIYPVYWFFTAVLLALYWAAPSQLADRSDVSLVKSFLLWPAENGPLLTVGWTLIFEMYFYAVTTLIIMVRAPIAPCLAIWATAVLAANYWGMTGGPAFNVATSPMTLLFIFGAAAGLCVPKSSQKEPAAAKSILVRLGDASYSTYLVHVMCISMIWRLDAVLPGTPRLALILLSLVASNVAGVVSFHVIERPALRAARAAWGARFWRQRPAV